MIKTIIFDLAEVYLSGLVGIEFRLAPLLNIDPKTVWAGTQGEALIELFKGKITEEEYWQRMIKRNRWKIDVDTLKRKVRENFGEIEGTRNIIIRLKSMGFKLGLLSTHAKEWIEFCNGKFDYHKLFDSVSYSFEAGVSKPDKKAYRTLLEKLNSKPEECIFIDDHPKNLASAKELGMIAILFTTPKQLENDLAKEGICLEVKD
jgi:HAD superfamily hydrolase (TIGR01509 family)